MASIFVGGDGANTLQGTAGRDLIYGYDPNGASAAVSSIQATTVATGFTQPVFAGAPAGDLGRLFVVEKGGLIKILDLASGQTAATPFLNLTSQISTLGERGLLGLAFDPDFALNGYVYVNLVNTAGDTEIRRYQVSSSNTNIADPASATPIITIDQPSATNHKAGWLGFGHDGNLYIPLGDGGDGGANAQNINSLLGKVLRIDVRTDAFPGDTTRNYTNPADNMFVGVNGADEIWALGLRNPFRDSFDRGTGDLFLADVGEGRWEEINLGAAGANYGWNVFEGPDSFAGGSPSAGVLTAPIHYYGRNVGATVIGGYVYRGPSDGLQGAYFFTDTATGFLSTLQKSGSNWVQQTRTGQVTGDTNLVSQPVSFGEDGAGALYIVGLNGEIDRLTPTFTSADQADDLSGLAGDDMIFAGGGADIAYGGAGEDIVYGGAGDDVLVLESDADIGLGGDGRDYLYGGDGADVLAGEAGVDVLIGGAGNDTAWGGGDQDYIYGGDGADTLRGGGDVDVLLGEAGNDLLYGEAGGDYFYGGDGFDTGYGGDGADIFVMGDGPDTAQGDAGNDYFYMGAGDDVMFGVDGVDVMLGEAGNDTFIGGLGVDYAFLGPGGAGDNDTALVDRATSGVLVMNNFEAGGSNDSIRLTGTGWTNFAQVQAAIADYSASGGFIILTLDADTSVWLVGVTPGQLTAADFAFA